MKYLAISMTLFTVMILGLSPLAQADDWLPTGEPTQIDAKLMGNSTSSMIDSNAENIGERLIRVYLVFTNFDIDNNNHFIVDVVQIDTGNLIESSEVKVYSSVEGLINFRSLVGFIVPLNSTAGDYQFEIHTINEILAEPVQFTVF